MKDIKIEKQAELILSFEESSFAQAVFAQLYKEFEKVGILIEFNSEDLLTFPTFKKRLADEMELIMRASPNSINQLLYVTDMPEQTVIDVFNTETEPIETLAEMLLFRISQKIYYREKYKLGLI
ncbi:MAG TPA: hypothetical protein VKY37_07910 [Brumimicrobium sp.]|nr:hypothetical protein [Brumimicrobium sp.]